MMSKTNDTSRPAALDDHRPLVDSELDAVTGGWLPSGIPGAAAAAETPWHWRRLVDMTLKSAG
jgi:hypothetical protein